MSRKRMNSGVAVLPRAAAEHGTGEDVEGGEQGDDAVALVIVGHRAHLPGLSGRPGWRRSRAWIRLLSSIDSTTAWAGGFMERPTMSSTCARRPGRRSARSADAVRLQAVGLPQALHRAQEMPTVSAIGSAGPVGGLARRLRAGGREDLRHGRRRQGRLAEGARAEAASGRDLQAVARLAAIDDINQHPVVHWSYKLNRPLDMIRTLETLY